MGVVAEPVQAQGRRLEDGGESAIHFAYFGVDHGCEVGVVFAIDSYCWDALAGNLWNTCREESRLSIVQQALLEQALALHSRENQSNAHPS